MKKEIPIEELLRWRLEQAEAEAPPAPRAARLLEAVRPWWEVWPERFQALAERLGRMQLAYGHAAERSPVRASHPVPTLIVRAQKEVEVSARVLYFTAREGRLRLRFQLEGSPEPPLKAYEAALISTASMRPVLAATATLSVESEYRIDASLPDELAQSWEALRVTDRMPFRLILRSEETNG